MLVFVVASSVTNLANGVSASACCLWSCTLTTRFQELSSSVQESCPGGAAACMLWHVMCRRHHLQSSRRAEGRLDMLLLAVSGRRGAKLRLIRCS